MRTALATLLLALSVTLLATSCADTRRYDPGDAAVPTTAVLPPTTVVDPEAVLALVPTTLPPDAVVHVVAQGDLLSALAARYGTTVEAIVEANDIDDPSNVPIGTRLLIP